MDQVEGTQNVIEDFSHSYFFCKNSLNLFWLLQILKGEMTIVIQNLRIIHVICKIVNSV